MKNEPVPRTIGVALLFAVTAAACGDDPARPGRSLQNDLVFRRADATIIPMPADVRAWCGPWEEGLIDTPAVHVVVSGSGSEGGWRLTAVRAHIEPDQPLSFPNDFVFDEPVGAHLFVYDPPNEASTAEEDASGSIVFRELDCSPAAGVVRFDIDAVLGSEFHDGTVVSVEGSFAAPMSPAP